MRGEVVGGHMRKHLSFNPSKEEDAEHSNSNSNMVIQSGYNLRESPKKSRKVSSFCHVCRICEKRFGSSQALFGHLRHHLGKNKKLMIPCKECGKEFNSMRSLMIHSKICLSLHLAAKSLNEDDIVNVVRRKRSKRVRCKASASSSSFSSFNESFSVTKIEQELEDGAMCLMLLSKSAPNFGCGSSCDHFTDVEVASPNSHKKVTKNEIDFSCVGAGAGQSLKMKRQREVLDSWGGHEERKTNESSDFVSEVSLDKQKKIELGVHVDDVLLCGTETKQKSNTLQSNLAGTGFIRFSACKNSGFDADMLASGLDSESQANSRNKTGYRCRTCGKVFKSHQALGGHQTSHRTSRSCIESQNNNFEEKLHPDVVLESKTGGETEKKLKVVENAVGQAFDGLNVTRYDPRSSNVKDHKCSICLRVFRSGRALGVHKRVHQTKGSKTREEEIEVIRRVLDPNLPAIVHEESTGDLER